MFRNLKKMLDDEEGFSTLGICMVEIMSCISPPSWLCCVPCLFGAVLPINVIFDILLAPGEICLVGMGILPEILSAISGEKS
jgi:hypothetical protein